MQARFGQTAPTDHARTHIRMCRACGPFGRGHSRHNDGTASGEYGISVGACSPSISKIPSDLPGGGNQSINVMSHDSKHEHAFFRSSLRSTNLIWPRFVSMKPAD